MDTQRLIALGAFLFSGMLLWEAWQKHTNPPVPKPTTPTLSSPAGTSTGTAGDVPSPSASLMKDGATAPPATSSVPSTNQATAKAVKVKTDKFDIEMSTAGADIRELRLLEHMFIPKGEDSSKARPYPLLTTKQENFYVVQTGLRAGEGVDLPNHNTVWDVSQTEFTLGPDSKELLLAFTYKTQGVTVEKIWKFTRGSYLVNVEYKVKNESQVPLNAAGYFQFARNDSPPPGESSGSNPFAGVATYYGPAVYTEEKKFQKVDFSSIAKNKADRHPAEANNGWVAMVQHYFLGAWLPSEGVKREYYTRKFDNGPFTTGFMQRLPEIAPGASATINVPAFIGPQDQDALKKLADAPINAKRMDLVVDYGIFHAIASPLFTLLQWIHSIVGNWGWAIIVLTILIKGVFYPLNAKAARSSAQMKALSPKIEAIRARHGDDRMKLNQATMELFKTEKVNPMGGCLPIVVQIPVFFALYWVLLGAIELRQAPWIFWIKDLSAPDPIYILPVLYAATMFIQTKLNPQPADPVQAKVMLYMPLIFAVFFFFVPSGLVLYWLAQNLITIAQQFYMNRVIAKEARAKLAKRN
jgi:YidC/Oxa1 family membrane protein insertase